MANAALLTTIILLLTSLPSDVSPATILCIFPHIGKSHFLVFEPLMKALAARGHDVHVLSHFPQKASLPNYTDISLEGSITEFESTGGFTFDMVAGSSLWFSFLGVRYIGWSTCDVILNSVHIQKLLQSQDSYDLVFSELFNTDCFLGFAHMFKAPQIALSSSALLPWSNERFGNPDNPAYIPNSFGSYSNRMNFKERLVNTFYYIAMKLLGFLPLLSQSISTEHFGKSVPSIDELARNTSMILVNTHPSLNGVRPVVPVVVDVGGIHVQPPTKLPEELDRWLNESRHGVVYFSMGSMLRAETIPEEKRAALLQAFAELPQRVLWKWEGDSLPGQPENVRVAKWLPQRDILNHPNVRVFITHGGLLGIIEAVMSAVPMVAIPIFGDQHLNCKALEQRGVAVILQYADISKESVLNTLKTVLDNTSYQASADRLSKQYLDRPSSPMDTAIFWTEYVIRHKGAHHLRSAAVEMTWYQYLLLDGALVLLAGSVLLGYLTYVAIRSMARLCRGRCDQKDLTKEKHKKL